MPVKFTDNSISIKNHFKSSRAFLDRVNYDFCLKRYSDIKTEEQALKTPVIKLREISLAFGQETPINMISAWLILLCDYLGIEIEPRQAEISARYIYEEAHFFNLAELTLCFKQISKGNYGNLWKFNPQIVIGAIKSYRSKRGMILSRQPSLNLDEIANRIRKELKK